MSEEITRLRSRLNEGLENSFENMLKKKLLLDQPVVISDSEGKPVVLSAEEAWQLYIAEKNSDSAARQ
ncbi:MAG: hypothetical protein K2J18_00715 [Paramuribaculum sp.]|nr:hypothetical protein [Paramuribaculum sp.]MDE7470932.1 hypothetical protein [Paramuribaculum sp.]